MFESKPSTQAAPPNAAVISAGAGFGVFYFNPPAKVKPTIQALNDLLAQNLFPVIAWKLCGSRVEPLTFCDPPECEIRFLLTAQKVYQLGPTYTVWASHDQWQQAVLRSWQIIRRIPDPPAPPSGPVQIRPGEGVAIFRH